jgi:hypothetical protein
VGNSLTNSGIIEGRGGTLTLGGTVSNTAGGLMTAASGNKLLVSQGLSLSWHPGARQPSSSFPSPFLLDRGEKSIMIG